LGRPHLEYANSMCSPTNGDVEAIEKIQKVQLTSYFVKKIYIQIALVHLRFIQTQVQKIA